MKRIMIVLLVIFVLISATDLRAQWKMCVYQDSTVTTFDVSEINAIDFCHFYIEEYFSTDIFTTGEWDRSSETVNVDESNGWLRIGNEDTDYGDYVWV